jgi:ribulose-5-phosphate 4-epimerase/fuculose-1-phosphate aldolase
MQRVKRLLQLLPRAEQAGLIDMSGGAFAVREANGFYITPQRLGEQWTWQLGEQDMVLFPGGGEASMARAGRRPCRESRLLRAILAACPQWHAVYHGHPWGLLSFALAQQPLPVPPHHAHAALGGERPASVPCVAYARDEEAAVVETLRKSFDKTPLGAVLVTGVGPFVAGHDVEPCLAFAESLEALARAQQFRLRQPQ